jgi:hypothetical protein
VWGTPWWRRGRRKGCASHRSAHKLWRLCARVRQETDSRLHLLARQLREKVGGRLGHSREPIFFRQRAFSRFWSPHQESCLDAYRDVLTGMIIPVGLSL